VGDFSIGKGSQKNDPHIMELYAALAVDHFYKHKPKQRGEAVVMSRNQENQITWQDMPEGVKSRLVNTTRFAFAWLIDMKEFFEVAQDRGFNDFMRYAPWSQYFFSHSKGKRNLPDFDSELGKLSQINKWCQEYLTWLGKLHRTTKNSFQIRLFNDDAFFITEGKITNQSENFNRLVADEANENDTVQRLTRSLINLSRTDKEIRGRGGTVGLARVLYVKSKRRED
jgi:hypothetical protein